MHRVISTGGILSIETLLMEEVVVCWGSILSVEILSMEGVIKDSEKFELLIDCVILN